jgi:hypothetical protein
VATRAAKPVSSSSSRAAFGAKNGSFVHQSMPISRAVCAEAMNSRIRRVSNSTSKRTIVSLFLSGIGGTAREPPQP